MELLSVIVPCYNEEENVAYFYDELMRNTEFFEKSQMDVEIIYVDDGSKDKTWEIITKLHKANPFVSGLKMSRNRGHQNALYGGLMTLKEYADAVISIDADLQDDINAIDKMLDKYEQGCDIVYGVRKIYFIFS